MKSNIDAVRNLIRPDTAGFTPIEYLNKIKKMYLHEIAQYSSLGFAAKKFNDPSILEGLAGMAATTGNHYLILSSMHGRMPNEQGNVLLEELTAAMFQVWNCMSNPDESIYDKFDKMYLIWARVEEHIEKQPTKR